LQKSIYLIKSASQSLITWPSTPKAGDVMRGTGGVRKLRWGKGGRGKSGGVRVIYYFHDARLPLYLLTLFAKNEQANLTVSERNALAALVDTLVATALERN
jgi:hypothetical protein